MKSKYSNDMISLELLHPGEMIKDEIQACGLIQKDCHSVLDHAVPLPFEIFATMKTTKYNEVEKLVQ